MVLEIAARFHLGPSERLVLETIWRNGAIPRIEIAKRIGLTGPHITRLTKDLEDRGLVSDTVLRDGARGQPVRPVSIAPGGAYALGVNFSHTFIEAGLVDLAGNLVTHEKLPLARATPAAVMTTARAALQRQCAKAGIGVERIVGAGFSVPGDFRAGSRKLNAHSFFPDLAGVDLAEAIKDEMPVPVFVENDAASAAVGERVLGAGRNHKSFVMVHIGHGIGSGLFLDGRLYRGANGNAGMIGILYPTDRPRPSGQDLFQTLSGAGIDATDFDDLEGLDLEDPTIKNWLRRAGAQLTYGLYDVSRIFDAEVIVLGGRLPPAMLQGLFDNINLAASFARDAGLPHPEFSCSRLGSYAGVVGASSVCFFATFFDAR